MNTINPINNKSSEVSNSYKEYINLCRKEMIDTNVSFDEFIGKKMIVMQKRPIYLSYLNSCLKTKKVKDVPLSEQYENEIIKEKIKYIQTKIKPYKSKFSLLSKDDLEKLEGIQNGLSTFKNMTINEIHFAFNGLSNLLILRNCHNNCSSCFVSAKKPLTQKYLDEHDNMIQTMAFEDYEGFVKDTAELQKRLDLDIFPHFTISHFYDSDPMFYYNNGKDLADVYKLWVENLDQPIQFDTSGWSPNFKKLNNTAQKINKLVNEYPNKFEQILISVNPFADILEYSYKCSENPEKAKRYKDLYIKKMAHTLYSLAPCCCNDNMYIAITALPNHLGTNPRECRVFVKDILEPVIKSFQKLLEENKNNYPLNIINKLQDKQYINNMITYRNIAYIGRGEGFGENYEIYHETPKNNEPFIGVNSNRIIDINGKVYNRENNAQIFKTDLSFNYINKNKKTPLIEGVQDCLPISLNTINRININSCVGYVYDTLDV